MYYSKESIFIGKPPKVSNIRKNVNDIYRLRVIPNSWDVMLSQDETICSKCDSLVSGDVISSFEFDNLFRMCSTPKWEEAISINQDLCDIGLTGFDNRFVDNWTGETYNPSGDTTFCLTKVSGDTFCYEIDIVEATETEPSHIQFCGGFFQGFYKLEEYDYQVLPNLYTEGWTKEFWLKKSKCDTGNTIIVTGETTFMSGTDLVTEIWEIETTTGGTCENKPKLNDMYPENEGIFYYWGARAENKFCLFSPFSGLTTCTGEPLGTEYEITPFQPKINPFLFYNRKQICTGDTNPTIETTDCCQGLINNAMAFRVDELGRVGIRTLTTTGECISLEGEIKFSGTPIMDEYYTDDPFIIDDNWHHVVYKFDPYDKEPCEGYRVGFGDLSIYVDGFLKVRVNNFREFIPYAFDEHRDKQLGVPYNISIGGGTQGLLESFPPLTGDTSLSGYTVCDYYTVLSKGCIFTGISLNEEIIESPPLTADEGDLIQAWLEMTITRRIGGIEVTRVATMGSSNLNIKLKGVIDSVEFITLEGGTLQVCKGDCYSVPPHDGKCGFLEDLFAGTFEGGIAQYRLHDRALCYSEIKCNYDTEKQKYNRHRDKPICIE